MSDDAPHMPFPDRAALIDWLRAHHADRAELWVQIYKKGADVPSLSWDDCVVACLIWGWIDGQKKSLDAHSYLQRITPRRARSGWSQRNRKLAEALIASGEMRPPGLAQIKAAKADGRWDRAYAGSADMVIPADFLAAVAQNPTAQQFYDSLNRANLYAIYYALTSAKTDATRSRRMAKILAQLERHEKFH